MLDARIHVQAEHAKIDRLRSKESKADVRSKAAKLERETEALEEVNAAIADLPVPQADEEELGATPMVLEDDEEEGEQGEEDTSVDEEELASLRGALEAEKAALEGRINGLQRHSDRAEASIKNMVGSLFGYKLGSGKLPHDGTQPDCKRAKAEQWERFVKAVEQAARALGRKSIDALLRELTVTAAKRSPWTTVEANMRHMAKLRLKHNHRR